MNISVAILIETLISLGGKKEKDDAVSFLKPNLVIKHKKSGIKYTILKIKLDKKTKKPCVICYRYYGPNSDRKFYIRINSQDFSKYKPV